MNTRGKNLPTEGDKIPYPQIYAAVRKTLSQQTRDGDTDGKARETGPPNWSRGELTQFFQRLGVIPQSHDPARASLRVLLAAREMAEGHRTDLQRVYSDLKAFTDPAEGICGDVPRCSDCPLNETCQFATRPPRIKDLPPHERPRERLLAEGEAPLRDSELLAILIGGGSGEESALDLAHRMLARFGGLGGIASASVGELLKIGGIGNAKVSRIRAAAEIGRRVATEPVNSGMAIRGSQQVFEHYRERMKGLKKETFSCLMLDTRHHLIRKEEVAVGSLNESVVHPREVFKSAINVSAAAVLFVHNHPSGNPQPSPQDRQLTKRLCEAGKLIGIQVLDHLIIGHERYYSFAEHGEVTA